MKRTRDPFETLAEKILRTSQTTHLPAERARVTSTSPLEMLLEDGADGTVLSENDADTEITNQVWVANPQIGDIIIIHPDGNDGYIASGVLEEEAPPPPPGSSDDVRFTVTAGDTLSGHRAVWAQSDGTIVYSDNSALASRYFPVWLTLEAIPLGGSGLVLAVGLISESSWSWTAGMPIYLGMTGNLTQAAPSNPPAAFSLRVAVAVTTTQVYFNPKSPILL